LLLPEDVDTVDEINEYRYEGEEWKYLLSIL
jgi:glutamine cyclotransferase